MSAQGMYSQHFIFFITYKLAQSRVLDHNRLDMRVWDKHSSLFDSFVSYKENEVMWMRPQGTYSQHFIFFVTYELAQETKVLDYIWLDTNTLAYLTHS
jgi:hypothetical protein